MEPFGSSCWPTSSIICRPGCATPKRWCKRYRASSTTRRAYRGRIGTSDAADRGAFGGAGPDLAVAAIVRDLHPRGERVDDVVHLWDRDDVDRADPHHGIRTLRRLRRVRSAADGAAAGLCRIHPTCV